MYTSFLLALPLLAPVLGHTIPRHPHAHRAAIPAALIDERDNANLSERSIPKAHFGIAPHNANGLSGVAGFQKRDGQRKVRRRKAKRSCTVGQHPVGVPNSTVTSSIGGGLHAEPSASASASYSQVVAPAITSASAVYSNVSSYEASTSTSSAAPVQSSTTSSGGSGGLSGLLAYVFPQGRGTADWTTVVDAAGSMSFDGALKPVTFGKLPSAGNAPDGSYALIANYPAGTVKLSAPGHGYSFYSSGDNDGIEITGAKEVVFSYSIMFQAGFQFNKGGKLPGLYGGTSLDMAKSCSGGRQTDRDDCFSARLMWRKDGMGEIYNYLPSAAYNNGNYCSTPPMSVCDPTYGESIGRGAFTWSSDGSWDTVAIRLKLNDANVANGEQEVFINGKSVISLKDLMISVNSETKIYGIMAQTFFGGSDSSWASPQDQSAYFKDWSLAVLA